MVGSVVLGLGDRVGFVDSFVVSFLTAVEEDGPAIDCLFAAVVLVVKAGAVFAEVVNEGRGAAVDEVKPVRPGVVVDGFLIDVVPFVRAEGDGIDLVCDVVPMRLERVGRGSFGFKTSFPGTDLRSAPAFSIAAEGVSVEETTLVASLAAP
jgi:hypothetical protein